MIDDGPFCWKLDPPPEGRTEVDEELPTPLPGRTTRPTPFEDPLRELVVNLLVLPNPDVLRLEEEYPVYLDGR